MLLTVHLEEQTLKGRPEASRYPCMNQSLVHGTRAQAEKFMSQRRNRIRGESWFERYLAWFADAYSIDWTQSPIPTEALDEINFARNDIQHGRPALGLGRYQTERHRDRFPSGLFIHDYERTRSDRNSL